MPVMRVHCVSCRRLFRAGPGSPGCPYCGCTLLALAPLPGQPAGAPAPRLLAFQRASAPWYDADRAAPLADLAAARDRFERQHGVCLGAAAVALTTETTLRWVLRNTNARDLYGRRTSSPLTTHHDVNQLLAGDDLPSLVPDESGRFRLADGVVAVYAAVKGEPMPCPDDFGGPKYPLLALHAN